MFSNESNYRWILLIHCDSASLRQTCGRSRWHEDDSESHSIVVSGIPSSCGRGRCMETGLHMCSPKSLRCKYLDQHCWSRLHKTSCLFVWVVGNTSSSYSKSC
ncbi:hypothetical protein AVEN_19626-1 [Araneus ventricosus]|uniref:Uncharacterized protein n=1 Tax=Araneus ventricosus TaxID=182803 RepID=A0A4Y2KJE1_ARAVE|nr:hypothetical protein AVEN_19626-1 [Araneus ventricosus]